MNRRARVLTGVASTLFVAACTGIAAERASGRVGTGVVLHGEELIESRGNLLRVLDARVVNSEVVQADGCQALQLRGRKSLQRLELPVVYVEGQRAASGCILETINPEDVSRVEVYAGGITDRAGYFSQPGGLILVFLKDGR